MAPQLYNFSDDPFNQFKDRIELKLRDDKIDDKIFGVVKDTYTQVLTQESTILCQRESNRLLRDILKDVLTDMLAEI